jgi:hypothetical protein
LETQETILEVNEYENSKLGVVEVKTPNNDVKDLEQAYYSSPSHIYGHDTKINAENTNVSINDTSIAS